jgi:hypothetical protein
MRNCAPRVWAFLAQDQPRALRPVGQVDQAGGLGQPGAIAGLAVGVVGRGPDLFRDRAQCGVDVEVVQVGADGELHPECVDVPGEGVGGPGGVGAHQHRHLPVGVGFAQRSGELCQRVVEHGDVVGGGVAAGVATAQQTREGFPSAGVVVIEAAQQRVEAEGLLPSFGRVFLVGVGDDQGRVQVDDCFAVLVGVPACCHTRGRPRVPA